MSGRDAIRREALAARAGLLPAARARGSLAIARRLAGFPAYLEARVVMAYASFRGEVMTDGIIAMALADGKTVALPVTRRQQRRLDPQRIEGLDRLVVGEYGIGEPAADAEPVDPVRIDLCLVPGVAFDPGGGRLGYGAGYYDRFLRRLRPDAIRAALAFEIQIVPAIPPRPGDQPVDAVITERRTIETGARQGGTR